jgi:hypothetical protein
MCVDGYPTNKQARLQFQPCYTNNVYQSITFDEDLLICSASILFGQRDLNLQLVRQLIASDNCDVNVADKFGITPLYQAATGGETGKLNT